MHDLGHRLRRAGIFHGEAGNDRVRRNLGDFGGGDGADKVTVDAASGTFYGGPGFDTVNTNRGRFIPGPQ